MINIISLPLLLVCWLWLAGGLSLYGQRQLLAMRNINNMSGLNGENVNKLMKDSRGLIWVGTERGLACYNGCDVHNLRMGREGQALAVNDIAELPDGRIVAATDGGVYLADLSAMTCRPIYAEIKDATSLCLLGGQLYAGSSAGVYQCGADGQAVLYPLADNVISQHNTVTDLCCDDSSHLWAASSQQVFRLDLTTRRSQPVNLSPYIHSGGALTIAKAGGHLFIGTSSDGLLRYDISRRRLEHYDLLPVSYVRDLQPGAGGLLYVSGNEPYTLDTQTDSILQVYGLSHYEHTGMELPSDGAYTYWRDEELDVSWFGFFLEGFSHNYHVRPLVEPYRWGRFDSTRLQVRSFCVHADDIIIGTRMGLYHINESRGILRHFPPEELGANVITDVVWFSNRFVITSFERGMRIYDPLTQRMTTPQGDAALAVGNFSSMAVSPDSLRLFAAGGQGIFVFDNKWHFLRSFDYRNSRLPDSYIPSVFFDTKGKAWIGTMHNLCIYDPKTGLIQADGFPEGFFNNVGLLSFNQADDGDVIAFAGSKIYKSRTDLSSFMAYDVPWCGTINFVLPFASGYLVGTNMGLFLFGQDFSAFKQFTDADGLPSLRLNKQEVARTSDGTIWMATSRGLIHITPRQQQELSAPSTCRLMLNYLSIDNREQEFERLLALMQTPEISLRWNFGAEKLTFSPLLLDYARHTARYYEYSLDGGHYLPILEGERTHISGLQMGRHTLCIRLAGHPETQTVFTIGVWPSVLFCFEVLFIITLCISIWALLRLRRRSIIHRQKLRLKHQLEREISAQSAVRQLLQQQERERLQHEREQESVRRDRVSGREYRDLQRRVKEHMELERPYRNVKFRLSDLAKAVGSTPTTVSLMLNENLGTNFYDFVNRYRLEEYKRRRCDERYAHLSMLAVAELCGFKKTTFFAVFKKFEECTPSEWAERDNEKLKGS